MVEKTKKRLMDAESISSKHHSLPKVAVTVDAIPLPPMEEEEVPFDPTCLGISFRHLESLGSDFPSVCLALQEITRKERVSYAMHLFETQKDLVSTRPTHFLSYSGSYVDTMSAMRSKLGKDEDVFVWVYFACFNFYDQNEDTAAQEYKDFLERLLALKSMEQAFMVLNLDQPIPAWGYLEWYLMVNSGVVFHFCLTPQQYEHALVSIKSGMLGRTYFKTLFKTIDMDMAVGDQDLMALLHEFGKVAINGVMRNCLKDWMLKTMRLCETTAAARDSNNNNEALACIFHCVGSLFWAWGELDAAEAEFSRAVKVAPVDSPLRCRVLNNLGVLLMSKSSLSEAEKLFREAIDLARSSFPQELANALANLGILLRDDTNNTMVINKQEAETLLKEAFELEPTQYGIALHYALFLSKQGKFKRSEQVLRSCPPLTPQEREDFPLQLNHLALLHHKEGNLLAAERLHREAMELNLSSHGQDSLNTATDFNNLARVLLKQKEKQEEAGHLGKFALQVVESKLGKDHPTSVLLRESWGIAA